MYVIELTNKTPCSDITIQLKFFYSAFYDGTENHFLTNFSDFKVGNERDNEVILSVNTVDIEMKLDDADFEKWANIYYELSTVNVTAQIVVGGIEIFGGYVKQNSIKGDMFRKHIKFQCVDQIYKLKEIDPRTNPLGYGVSEKVNILQLFKDIFTTDTFFEFPHCDDVISLSTLQARIDASNYVDYDLFAIVPYRIYFSPTSPYTSMIDVVKSLVISYGLIPYFGLDEKLYLIPRIYQNNSYYNIENNRIGNFELQVVRKMLGLKVRVWNTDFDPFTYQTKSYGDVITDPERVETITCDQSGGTMPNPATSHVSVFLWDGSNYNTEAVADSFRRKNADGSYSSEKSLWELVGDDVWDLIQNDRINYKVELPGDWDSLTGLSKLLLDHGPKQFYRLEQFPDNYLRPRLFKFNLTENKVEIDSINV